MKCICSVNDNNVGVEPCMLLAGGYQMISLREPVNNEEKSGFIL